MIYMENEEENNEVLSVEPAMEVFTPTAAFSDTFGDGQDSEDPQTEEGSGPNKGNVIIPPGGGI